LRFLKRTLKRQGKAETIVTDYPAAMCVLGNRKRFASG
jgi:transposase-like protein